MEIKDKIKEMLHGDLVDKNFPHRSIKMVYLFGSSLTQDSFKPGSDIDIGFMIDHELYVKDPLAASYEAYNISTRISLLLNRKTDVVLLNSASIETAYRIISTGILLYEKDPEYRMAYEIALKGKYFDFKPFLENLRKSA